MDFKLDVRQRGGVCVVRVYGDVDLYTSSTLDACLQQLIASGKVDIAVDLENCTYCDSEGIKALIAAWRYVGGKMILCGVRDSLSRVFEISGLDGLFRILPSVEDISPWK